MPGIVGLGKRFEQALLIVPADPDAGVLDHQFHLDLLWLAGGLDIHPDLHFALLGELDGIAHQVRQDLFEAQGVDLHITFFNAGIELQ